MIEKHGLDARLITMFHRMDREGGGLLRGEQLPGYHHCGRKHQHGNKVLDPEKNS